MKTPTLKQLKPSLSFIKNFTRPLLTNVIVTKKTMRLCDLETFIEIKNNYDLNEGTYDVKTLGLTTSNNLDVKEYPHFDFKVNELYSFRWNQKSIESFLPYASNDGTRLYLSGVAISQDHIVATNGHVLKLVDLKKKNENDTFIIPRTSLKILNSLLKKYKSKDDFKCSLDQEYFYVKNSMFNFKARLIQREYPKYKAVIPVKSPNTFTIKEFIDFKELKPLFNKGMHCGLTILDGMVNLFIKGHDKSYLIGHSQDTDKEITIGFNASYLAEIMKNQKEVTFKYNNELSPVIFENDTQGVIMPLKL